MSPAAAERARARAERIDQHHAIQRYRERYRSADRRAGRYLARARAVEDAARRTAYVLLASSVDAVIVADACGRTIPELIAAARAWAAEYGRPWPPVRP